MQKRFVQATATAVLFATMAMPAFASDGEGRGNGWGRLFASLKQEQRIEKQELKELKKIMRDARRDWRGEDEDDDDENDAAEVCMEAAARAHAQALATARTEKKAAYSAADLAYHASLKTALAARRTALKAALDAFKASDMGAAAQATFVAAHVKAHADYNAAMSAARQARATAKATAEAKWIAAKAKADADLKAAKENCKTTTTPPPAADTTAPAAIANLSLSGAASSSLTLSWTATGDDGSTGTAASYDVRYSTSPITTFSSATQVTGEPVPAVAGTSQGMTVSGLSPSTLYYFRITVIDEAGNVSAMSNEASLSTLAAPDTTAPAAVTLSLSVATQTSALVSWVAPGDDGSTGTAASYDLRYSTSPISTAADFTAATQVSGEPVPAVAGTAQAMTVTGLTANTTYYFALKAQDEVPNVSAMSNVATVTTLP